MKKFYFYLFSILLFTACQDKDVTEEIGTDSGNRFESQVKAASVNSAVFETFTVLTYNVAGLPAVLSSSDPETNTPLISALINDYDLVQVQEDFNYHAALYADDYHPYRTATSGGAGIGDGLNTLSNFPFSDDIDRVAWDDCSGTDGNCLTPKGFTLNRIRLDEGVYLDVYNCHTNAGSVDAAYEARRKNILQMVDYINSNSVGNAVLLTGDWNCRYTRSEDNIRLIPEDVGATDSWVELIKNGIAPEQGSDALVCDETAILTEFDCEVVDKIFYRSNNYITLIPAEFTYEDEKFRDENGAMLSDHRPVFTEFQWTLNTDFQFSDQFGGPHGTSYNDVNLITSAPVVTQIGIRSEDRVDQVNLSLSDGTTFTHGGTGGTAQSLTMEAGEYISEVTLNSGKEDDHTRIFYISFMTNQGRSLSGGSTTDTTQTFTAPEGWQIVGFHGRAGTELDKLGVIYARVNN
jgi:endonuclease/exonuclease/phosphatase family metal-dependent hydrolase